MEKSGLGKLFKSKFSKSLEPQRIEEMFPSRDFAPCMQPCEFGLPEASLGSGRGRSIFGSSLTQLVQREKA